MKKSNVMISVNSLEQLNEASKLNTNEFLLNGEEFSIKVMGKYFTEEEMKKAIELIHTREKKVWLSIDIVPHDKDLDILEENIEKYERMGIDGVLVADLGTFQVVKEKTNLPISVIMLSSNTNWRAVKMWKDLGAKRVVLATEISIDNIHEIRRMVPEIEIEVFIHGGMQMSTSGRDLMSSFISTKIDDFKKRNNYFIEEETRPGEFMPVFEDQYGTHIFHSKDLCTIEYIDKILNLGVDAVKIDARLLSSTELKETIKVYLEAMDNYYTGDYKYNEEWLERIKIVGKRGYTAGFYFTQPGEKTIDY